MNSSGQGLTLRQQVERVHYSAPNTEFTCESGCRLSAVIMGGKCHFTTVKRQAVITLRNERLSYREKLSGKKTSVSLSSVAYTVKKHPENGKKYTLGKTGAVCYTYTLRALIYAV